MMKKLIISICVMLAVVPMLARADVVPVPEPPDPVEPPETEEPVLNASQQQKIQRLSEASGVSEEEILALRMRTTGENDTDPSEDPLPDPEDEPEADAPNGRGWGVIARWLGLHPGILGHGTGDKFYPEKDDEESLLSMRESKRAARFFSSDIPDTHKETQVNVNGKKANKKYNEVRSSERKSADNKERKKTRSYENKDKKEHKETPSHDSHEKKDKKERSSKGNRGKH